VRSDWHQSVVFTNQGIRRGGSECQGAGKDGQQADEAHPLVIPPRL
jgi:hypothetical protein